MTTEPAVVEPDLDTVLSENAELRAALAHHVGDDLDAHLEGAISYSRTGEVRYTPAESEPASGDEPEANDPAAGDPPSPASPAAAPNAGPRNGPTPRPRPAPRRQVNTQPVAKTADEIGHKMLADGDYAANADAFWASVNTPVS